ncbi:hypothetical protein BJN34_22590 [Cupriavidus necator]|uniref:Flagellar brake protein YcgR n=1 Tax=Cupriavidus necator TaxID=106590 RepID=A0A1U9UX18_CUPNE|nr:flagellar brake protein [Cupriavidus necator]AQV96655.1 hypothetical protein BJN34_22590 [Cupriavidus necator]
MGISDHTRSSCAVFATPTENQQSVQSHPPIDPTRVSLALQDLAWLKCRGRLYGRCGYSMTTTLLSVNSRAKSYIFEGCRTPAEQDFLLASGEILFSASLRGVPIRFAVRNPHTIRYQGGLACHADFPAQLEYVDRRHHPRVLIAPAMNYTCELQTPGGALLELGIDNLSQTGVGLHTTSNGYRELPTGTTMHDCRLYFGTHGVMDASLQAVGHGTVQRHQATFHLIGCTFLSLTSSQRTFIQRLIYQIEFASDADWHPPTGY